MFSQREDINDDPFSEKSRQWYVFLSLNTNQWLFFFSMITHQRWMINYFSENDKLFLREKTRTIFFFSRKGYKRLSLHREKTSAMIFPQRKVYNDEKSTTMISSRRKLSTMIISRKKSSTTISCQRKVNDDNFLI